MDVLDKVRQWVRKFPLWEEGNLLYIDFTDGVPGNVGIFPEGLQVLSRREDVLGRKELRCRYNFCIYRVGDSWCAGDDARWLLRFQDWVLQQSAAGLAPVFGDVPGMETIRAEKGKLREKQPGMQAYAVVLTADFVRKFEKQ